MTETADGTGYPIRLEPLPITRRSGRVGSVLIAGTGIALAVIGFAVSNRFPAFWSFVVLGSLFAVYGVILVVRLPGIVAIVDHDDVLVRGIFGSSRIRRDQITSITQFPTIKWNDETGRARSTPVNALNVRRDRALPVFIANADRGIAVLADWASVGRPS